MPRATHSQANTYSVVHLVCCKPTITQRWRFGYKLAHDGTLSQEKCDNSNGEVCVTIQPMGTTHKKVIVRKLDRDTVNGYVSATFISDGKVEVLNTSGNVVSIDLRDVKGIYFVREFGDSESLTRKTFASRPRTEGLWVRLRFRDNEIIEGMMPNDLVQEGPDGFLIIPPDTRSNTQRIFVPRSALAEMSVLAVIGERKTQRQRPDDTRQVPMFT